MFADSFEEVWYFMDGKKLMAGAALAGVLAFGTAVVVKAMDAPTWKGNEKCAGIAAKGKNDCGTSKHGCGGQAAVDRDPEEWIYLPEGSCGKIAGGTLVKG